MKNEKNNTMYYKPVYHEEFPIGAYFRDNYNANVDTIQFGGRYDFNACKEYLDNNDELILIHKYEVIPVKNDKIEGVKTIYESKDPFKNYIIVLSYSEKKEEGIVQIHYSCDGKTKYLFVAMHIHVCKMQKRKIIRDETIGNE